MYREPDAGCDVDGEANKIHGSAADFIRELAEEGGHDALDDDVGCYGDVYQLQACLILSLKQGHAWQVYVGGEAGEHHCSADEEGDASFLRFGEQRIWNGGW